MDNTKERYNHILQQRMEGEIAASNSIPEAREGFSSEGLLHSQSFGLEDERLQQLDENILEAINTRFAQEAHLDLREVEVSVVNCEVWLAGRVKDQETKTSIENQIKLVPSVKHIRNDLVHN
jgi:BON domain